MWGPAGGGSMGASSPVVVTEAGAEFDQPTANPPSLPAAGGAVTIAGNTSDPDGTVLHLLLGGSDTGLTATVASGAYTFTYTAPANTALTPLSLSFTVST